MIARRLVPVLPMFVLFAALATANFSAAETLSGRAIVTDGDTIIVAGSKVRMEGIDAPETDQICLDVSGDPHHCGLLAKAALSRLIGRPDCPMRS